MKRNESGPRYVNTSAPARLSPIMPAFAALFVLAFALPVMADTGAIFTTFSDGTTVNGNIYPSNDAVYINGGPQNPHGSGKLEDGDYYFQVTDPSGTTLLSSGDISCRQLTVSGGVVVGASGGSCPHPNGTPNPANGSTPVKLAPFDNTPNNGDEYKVWLTKVNDYNACPKDQQWNFGFCNINTKTDNFKVRATVSYVKVCKFNDLDGDGLRDGTPPEPLIPHWPITADPVDTPSGLGSLTALTGEDGCETFSYSGTYPVTVTLTEGTVGSDWTKTAPTGPNTVTVSALGTTVTAPSFGNHNEFCTSSSCNLNALAVSKTATPSFTRTFTWGISKAVDKTLIQTSSSSATFNYTVSVTHDSGTDSNWQVKGLITAANPGTVDVTNVTVSDSVDDGGSCSVDTSFFTVISAGTHVTTNYNCTYSSAPSPAKGTNTATETFSNNSGTATFDFGGVTPTVVDGSVSVTDSLGGDLGTASSSDSSPKTLPYPYTNTGTRGTCVSPDNTATFTTNTTGTRGSASQTVKLCVGADLTVSKTATPVFTRKYKWGTSKSVDKTVIATSGSATFNYTVSVTHDSGTDSGWQVTGTITVKNPNDWEAITATVTDAIGNGDSCTVSGGSNTVTVPASGSKDLQYSCIYASAPSSTSGTNTATATWDKAAAYTADGSKSGTADASFTTPTTIVDGSVAVTDTLVTGSLGTASYTDPSPKSFTYSHTFTVPTLGCVNFNNTATFKTNTTGTTGSASQSVQVCGTGGFLTNTSLCTFDTDPNTTGTQFNLIYTNSTTVAGAYTLTASNPGQWYYNVGFFGTSPGTVSITLPYPFVTQGAQPVHVYTNVTSSTSGGTTCLTPPAGSTGTAFPNALGSSGLPVTLASSYGSLPQSLPTDTTTTVTVPVPAGFSYINIHVDYGLKNLTGYTPGGTSPAIDAINSGNLTTPPWTTSVHWLTTYAFSDSGGGAGSMQNENIFKNDPGIAGLVLTSGSGTPLPNVVVKIYSGSSTTGTLLATLTTDANGFYQWSYKYTGKAATFTVFLPNVNSSQVPTNNPQTATLKSNGFLYVPFTVLGP